MRLQILFLLGVMVAGVVGCGKASDRRANNGLSGQVTLNGQPAPSMALVVTGPEGKTAGGTTDLSGRYLIPDPPQGSLQFYFIPSGQRVGIPGKYTMPGNELSCQFTGGHQTYDIDLKP